MKAKVLDVVTGETEWRNGVSSFQWAHNNWSCDCNRYDYDEFESTCQGCMRYLVIGAEFDKDEVEYSLHELNIEYPEELLIKHGIIKGCKK